PPPVTYTLSLHDALPIWPAHRFRLAASVVLVRREAQRPVRIVLDGLHQLVGHLNRDVEVAKRIRVALRVDELLDVRMIAAERAQDRKSTRLNSSHVKISY